MSHQAPRANRLKVAARTFSLLVATGLCVAAGAAGPTATTVPLGARQSGGTYPLTLSAKNESCPQPLDFRFTSHASWIRLPNDPVARQVPQGQTRDLNATLDFTAIGPGALRGNVTVECENCGWFLFQNCTVDRQDLSFEVQVVPRDPSKPYAQPARPADAKPSIMPYRPPQEAIDRLNAAQAALAVAQENVKRCDEAKLAELRKAARDARGQADYDRRNADKEESLAKDAEAKAVEGRTELEKATTEYYNAWKNKHFQEELLKEAENPFAKGREGGSKTAVEDAKKRLRWATKEWDYWKEESPSLDRTALWRRGKADEAKQKADASEGRAKAAEAALQAAEDECARLKKAVDDARVDVEIAQLELDKARRGEK